MGDEGLDERAPEVGENYSREGEKNGLGTENEEISRVENDKGMVDLGEAEELTEKNVELDTENENRELPSSNKRVNPSSIDRLSELPDSLLIHILSFMDVKRAAVTSVLSKRWRFLWCDLPKLEFWESDEENWDTELDEAKIGRFVSFVNKAIANRTVKYLKKLVVYFQYSECYASDVDGWVEFALKIKVKRLLLMLNSYEDYYMLPGSIFSNSSLERLWMRGCILAPQRKIEWQSLTDLFLKEVELNQDVLDGILSGCPVLNALNLAGCWGFDRVEVNSRSLHRLTVEDCEYDDDDDDEPLLEISAPYVHSLDVSVFPEGRKMQIKNIQSLVEARVNFNGDDWESTSAEAMSIAKDLLERFQLVKELNVGHKFFEVVSMMVVNNWLLPQSTRVGLHVSTASDYEYTVSGIVGLLESSPNLESLVVHGFDTESEYAILEPDTTDDLSRDLPKLKTVNIRNLGDALLPLIRILLKRAIFLEKMVIMADVNLEEDFDYIRSELLTFPSSSQGLLLLLHP